MTAQLPAAEEMGLLARSRLLSYSASSHYLLCLFFCIFCPESSESLLQGITVFILFAKAVIFLLHFTCIFLAVRSLF